MSTRPSQPAPLTVPESSDYHKTSSHADVLEFLRQVRLAQDPRIVVSRFGTSSEGRELPLVIVADPTVRTPEEARASGKPVVFVMANIHAGEVEGKEAVLQLLRDVVWGAPGPDGALADPWPVDQLVTLIAPIYNADGNDRFGPKNRPLQQGPDTAGQRANAQDLDLNRDAMKLESPEARALAGLYRAWDPLLFVDLHTTDGSAHGYDLTYAGPLNPSVHPDILRAEQQDWLPELRARVRDRDGFELYDYGNFLEEGEFKDEVDKVSGWRTFDHRPRFGTNEYGLRNRFAILSEAYSYADFRTRIAATKAFVREILNLSAERGDDLVALCHRADEETVAQARQGELRQFTGADLVSRGDEPVLLRAFRITPNATTGEDERVADGERSTVTIPAFVQFEGTGPLNAPRAYYLPPASPDFDPEAVIEVLRTHGIRLESVSEAREAQVDVFTVRDTSAAAEEYQKHHERKATLDVATQRRTLPAGTLRVPVDQPLGRLVFQALDPRADDGLLVWDFFDGVVGRGAGTELPLYAER
ncbi:MAG TPA: M14 family metallopeptidase [Planctomycetota bacterium]|nr:M14 family metallopeptidase [Planctomycetota bacterium]